MNRKADFLQNESIRIDLHNESNRFESICITNRIDSNRELECSTLRSVRACDAAYNQLINTHVKRANFWYYRTPEQYHGDTTYRPHSIGLMVIPPATTSREEIKEGLEYGWGGERWKNGEEEWQETGCVEEKRIGLRRDKGKHRMGWGSREWKGERWEGRKGKGREKE